MNWWKAKQETVKREVVVVKSTRLRLEEWCADHTLVKQAYDLQETPIFKAMLAVLRNDSPMNSGLLGANPEDRVILAAQSEGYMMCLNNLEAMATTPKQQQFIESTFKPE